MSCTVIGFEDAMGLFKEIEDSELRKVLSDIGDKGTSVMKGAVAVDTGATKASIKKSIRKVDQGMKLTIRINKEYYLNQEFGTSRSNPRNVQRVYSATRGIDDYAISELEGLVAKRK